MAIKVANDLVRESDGCSFYSSPTLGEVGDVSSSTATDGQVLTWDEANLRWEPASVATGSLTWGSISGTLSSQTDLQNCFDSKEDDFGNPAGDGYILSSTVSGTKSWVDPSYLGGGASDIDDLSDVDTTTTAPTDGQVLSWDNSSSQWKPADQSVDGSIAINDLTDVNISSIHEGDFISYCGGVWGNHAINSNNLYSDATRNICSYTVATNGDTTFSGQFDGSNVDVYVNGQRLPGSEYTISGQNVITNSGLCSGWDVELVGWEFSTVSGGGLEYEIKCNTTIVNTSNNLVAICAPEVSGRICSYSGCDTIIKSDSIVCLLSEAGSCLKLSGGQITHTGSVSCINTNVIYSKTGCFCTELNLNSNTTYKKSMDDSFRRCCVTHYSDYCSQSTCQLQASHCSTNCKTFAETTSEITCNCINMSDNSSMHEITDVELSGNSVDIKCKTFLGLGTMSTYINHENAQFDSDASCFNVGHDFSYGSGSSKSIDSSSISGSCASKTITTKGIDCAKMILCVETDCCVHNAEYELHSDTSYTDATECIKMVSCCFDGDFTCATFLPLITTCESNKITGLGYTCCGQLVSGIQNCHEANNESFCVRDLMIVTKNSNSSCIAVFDSCGNEKLRLGTDGYFNIGQYFYKCEDNNGSSCLFMNAVDMTVFASQNLNLCSAGVGHININSENNIYVNSGGEFIVDSSSAYFYGDVEIGNDPEVVGGSSFSSCISCQGEVPKEKNILKSAHVSESSYHSHVAVGSHCVSIETNCCGEVNIDTCKLLLNNIGTDPSSNVDCQVQILCNIPIIGPSQTGTGSTTYANNEYVLAFNSSCNGFFPTCVDEITGGSISCCYGNSISCMFTSPGSARIYACSDSSNQATVCIEADRKNNNDTGDSSIYSRAYAANGCARSFYTSCSSYSNSTMSILSIAPSSCSSASICSNGELGADVCIVAISDNGDSDVYIEGIPTSDPVKTNAIWNDGGSLVFSGSTAKKYIQVSDSSYTASAGDMIMAQYVNVDISITLPASPEPGDCVKVFDSSATFDTNNVTISGNGETIMASTSPMMLDVSGTEVKFVYNGSDWRMVNA